MKRDSATKQLGNHKTYKVDCIGLGRSGQELGPNHGPVRSQDRLVPVEREQPGPHQTTDWAPTAAQSAAMYLMFLHVRMVSCSGCEPDKVANETQVISQLLPVLNDAARIYRALGFDGMFELKPAGQGVVGSPDLTWVPTEAERAAICVEVKSPWQLSTWTSTRPLDPPYSPAMDFTNLVHLKDNVRVKNAIGELSEYMLLRLNAAHIFRIPLYKPIDFFLHINKHKYDILSTYNNTWILQRGVTNKFVQIAVPFRCDANPPDLTLAQAIVTTIIMAHDRGAYYSESQLSTQSKDTRRVLPLSLDPCVCKELTTDDLVDMHIVDVHGSCTLMRGTFRGHKCIMKFP